MYEGRGEPGDASEPPGVFSFLDQDFPKSRKGTVLAAELGLSLIIFICFAASVSSYLAAPLLEFFITLAFYFLYATKYHERFSSFNWPCVDFLRCVSAVIVMAVVSIAAAARSGGEGGAVAGALFGFVVMAVFSYDAYGIFRTEMAQQESADPKARRDSSYGPE
ncbi:CKLF-like MARVEL transmembrane domain-containing protein 5 [Ambystoma mexicanum]|uniref:CKLF-like MARVEL transmembrane domain-containing protein 5 n=1 Tax=Ambystoma mexicanum TaxID=8296 RepID=UPI0037E6F7D3